jgi:hypothetical protein
MFRPERVIAGQAGPIRHPRGTTPARLIVVAVAAVLAACSPTPPSASPAAPTPAPSPVQPSTSPLPALTTPPPSPAPTPAAEAWAKLALPPAPEIGATLAAVSGSPYAADPAAGFRLRATGAVPLAALLERLRVEPALAYGVKAAPGGRSAVLRPSAPLEPGASYRFTLVDPAGASLTGWAFQVAGPPRVVGTLPRNETTDVPIDTGIEITFDQDGVVVERGDIAVRLVPEGTPVAGAIEMHGRAAVFVPGKRLLEGRVYEVLVRAGTGATAQAGGLARDVAFAFQVERKTRAGRVQAELDRAFLTALPGDRPLLEARQWRTQPNGGEDEVTTPVALRIYRLPGEAAAITALERLLGAPAWAGASARPIVPTAGLSRVFSGRAGFVRDGWDRCLRLPIAPRTGWYLVELRQGSISQAVLQVTEIAAMAGARADTFIAWVNDAGAGRPVQGARVEVVGGSRLGRTDASGLLVAETPAGLARAGSPVLVRMTADAGRRVIVDLAAGGGPVTDEWGAWVDPGLDTWWTALSTDRWLYRPNDTIQAWGYLRARGDDRTPSVVRLRVWRGTDDLRNGRPVATADVQQATTGAWVGSIRLRDMPHGYYVLEVLADGRVVEAVEFEVGEVRKPPYQLAVSSSSRAIVEGDPITATVTAHFFDGTPAAGIPVAVQFDVRDTEPVEATTDMAGVATVRLMPRLHAQDRSQHTCALITVQPAGPVEAYVGASQEICVFRGMDWVDIEATQTGGSLVLAGAVHAVDLARVEAWLADRDHDWNTFKPQGAARSGRSVELVVTETVLRPVVSARWYDAIAKRVVEQYDWEDGAKTTFSRAVTTRADGTYRLRLAAASGNRSWEVNATVVDDVGRRIVASAWASEPRGKSPVSDYWVRTRGADDGGTTVGESVTAAVVRSQDGNELPVRVGGANRFLFVITGPTRFDAIVSPKAEATVRFEASDEPSLEFQVVWFTGRGYALPGGTSASLRTDDRKLDVALTVDRARYEPGARASVTVRTADAAGHPVSASVLLRGVDEKLLAMGVAGFADPIDLIYRSPTTGLLRGPVVSHAVVFAGNDGGKGSTTGGGGGDRTDFGDALPMRMVTTGADGRAEVSFDLPDDVTSWRVAATAMTGDRHAGSTSILLPVGLPFFADATIAPEYLAADRVSIRLRAFGSALVAGQPVRFTVSSETLAMAPVTVDGTAFAEVLVTLPALTTGTHRVTIAASSTAGADRLVRTFRVVESRLTAGHRETVAITGPTTPPGGPGLTRLVFADAGRARYLELLGALATPRGQRADERIAAGLARRILVEQLGITATDLPSTTPFARATYQAEEGGLALLPYDSPDLELTVRALLSDPGALLADSARSWLRAAADDAATPHDRRTVALVGLAALGEPVLASLVAALDEGSPGDRTRLWAAIGLAILGDRDRAVAVERSLLARWGERRGDEVRLRVSDDAEEVSEATELLALLAALVDDPLAADLLAYVVESPPLDDLAVLAQVTVAGRLVARLPAEPAVVALVEGGTRSTLQVPAGGTLTMEVTANRRAQMRLEPVSGAAAVTASWDEPAPSAAALGLPDPDLSLTRTALPASPIAANSLVHVRLDLRVEGPGRTGAVEVTDLVPSGLAVLGGPEGEDRECGRYAVSPSRIDGQRVTFVVSFDAHPQDSTAPVVPGTFCLRYMARVVTAGTYAWQPAVARQATSPGMVATTPAGIVELR